MKKCRTIADLRAHPDVLDVWSEREIDGRSWWLDVVPGFQSPGSGCHVFHEDTVAELCADFNDRRECVCEECRIGVTS